MNKSTRAIIEHYVERLDLSGNALEIGGHRLSQSAQMLFAPPRFRYFDLNIRKTDVPDSIVGNICDCREQIADESFDLVVSSAVFEHIDRPWLAASEIARILRPGGIAITWTVWSWRYHPTPIDYWRFSPECLEFLFSDLELLEKGYDLSRRRRNQMGSRPSGTDSVPVDELGGWRENWGVYCVHRKGVGPSVMPFKASDHPLAEYMRADTQGTPTNPKFTGVAVPAPLDDVAKISEQLDRIVGELGRVQTGVAEFSARLRDADDSRRPIVSRISRRVGGRLRNLVPTRIAPLRGRGRQ